MAASATLAEAVAGAETAALDKGIGAGTGADTGALTGAGSVGALGSGAEAGFGEGFGVGFGVGFGAGIGLGEGFGVGDTNVKRYTFGGPALGVNVTCIQQACHEHEIATQQNCHTLYSPATGLAPLITCVKAVLSSPCETRGAPLSTCMCAAVFWMME